MLAKLRFSQEEIANKLLTLTLNSKKVQDIFGETLILTLLSSAVFRLPNHVLDFF